MRYNMRTYLHRNILWGVGTIIIVMTMPPNVGRIIGW